MSRFIGDIRNKDSYHDNDAEIRKDFAPRLPPRGKMWSTPTRRVIIEKLNRDGCEAGDYDELMALHDAMYLLRCSYRLAVGAHERFSEHTELDESCLMWASGAAAMAAANAAKSAHRSMQMTFDVIASEYDFEFYTLKKRPRSRYEEVAK